MKTSFKDLDECKEEVFFDISDQFAVLQCFHRIQKIDPFVAASFDNKDKFSTQRRNSPSTARTMLLRYNR